MRRENILLRLIPFNDYDNKNFKMFIVIKNTKVIILKNKIFVFEQRVKSRLLCKMLYNVFTISTYQN
ncbi:NADH-quinone oxidoreductase subunit L [Staphylococcus aureus]|nr:NADH-quinone oxidoreductase subunit L [Staphylococcus aureus]